MDEAPAYRGNELHRHPLCSGARHPRENCEFEGRNSNQSLQEATVRRYQLESEDYRENDKRCGHPDTVQKCHFIGAAVQNLSLTASWIALD